MKTAEEWLQVARAALDRSLGADHAWQFDGDLADAVSAFDQVLANDPTNHAALRERGLVLVMLERHEEALDSFVAAASQRPPDVELLRSVATALARLKDFVRALAAFEEVLRLEPRDPAALVGRAEALTELERDELAIAAWDEAITVLDTRHVELQGKRVRDLTDDHKAGQARAARASVLARRK